jgi:flagellar basal-body rod protein FlgB
MFIERLLNQGNTPLLERMLEFTAQRHRLLAENIVNVDTPEYRQKDLSIGAFREMLSERVEARRSASPGEASFDDVSAELENPTRGILFHDGNNRSMEQLMSDQASNALMHNMVVELLRKQYSAMEMALKERVE